MLTSAPDEGYLEWAERKRKEALNDMHGRSGYWRGCRCHECKEFGRLYYRDYRARKAPKVEVQRPLFDGELVLYRGSS